jgi:peptidoglycan/xylan/chitin deacetylase (PgdA/CDA1 family)
VEFERGLLEAHALLSAWAPPRWFRPGSGWYTDWMLDLLEAQGYRCALGSVYPLDSHVASVRFASWWIGRGVGPGSIIILHDGGRRGERTAGVLERVLPGLRARGLEVVTLSDLVRRAGDPSGETRSDSAGKPEA